MALDVLLQIVSRDRARILIGPDLSVIVTGPVPRVLAASSIDGRSASSPCGFLEFLPLCSHFVARLLVLLFFRASSPPTVPVSC